MSRMPLEPRGLSRAQAAAYVGLSPSAFDAARKKLIYSDPTLAGGRWDRKILDAEMDRQSNLGATTEQPSALAKWRQGRGKNQAAA